MQFTCIKNCKISKALSRGNGLRIVVGGLGNDTIGGQAGSDLLFGGAGHDLIDSGTDNDVITGGGDTFMFKSNFGHDTLTDISFNEGDRIVFFAGAIDSHNIKITDMSDLHYLVSVASSINENGNDLTLGFGSNSLTLEGLASVLLV